MNQLSIGEFAKASRLSAKALRLYAELGLLVPARVDPDTGYRWYAPGQLASARLVATLRRVGVPLARIRDILDLPAAEAAAEIRAYWTGAEVEHGARRELVGDLVDQLEGKRSAMSTHEVAVREMPARSLLSMIRRAHEEELIPIGRELFIHRLRGGEVPRPPGIAGAPFFIYHGEVSGDSDGPVEWCWPVPDDQAEALAARFPDLTLRTEPAHEEAFVRLGKMADPQSPTQAEVILRSMAAWAAEQHRQAAGGVRMILVPNPANGKAGPDGEFAIPLR